MTEAQKKLSRKYLIYEALTNAWFVAAIWLYFYRIFITDQQIGILDGVAFAVGLLAEVPSGALADRFGRDRLVKLGQILVGLGFLIQAFGSSFAPFFVGQMIMMIGVSFISGADEALFFDKLNFKRESLEWRKLVTRCSQVGLIASVVTVIAGGILYNINPRIPWILTGLFPIFSVFWIWNIKEDRVKKSTQKLFAEIKENLITIKEGFQQFLKPKLWLYVPIIITVQGLFYTAGWGLLKVILLDRFHFSVFWGSVVIASSSLIAVGVLHFMHKYAKNVSERSAIVTIAFSAVAGLFLSIPDIGLWGYFVILILHAGENILYPFMSEVLNNHAPSEKRATVLSVASFLRTIPYVALAPIIGYLNTNGSLEYFLSIWAILILLSILIYLFLKRRDERVAFPIN